MNCEHKETSETPSCRESKTNIFWKSNFHLKLQQHPHIWYIHLKKFSYILREVCKYNRLSNFFLNKCCIICKKCYQNYRDSTYYTLFMTLKPPLLFLPSIRNQLTLILKHRNECRWLGHAIFRKSCDFVSGCKRVKTSMLPFNSLSTNTLTLLFYVINSCHANPHSETSKRTPLFGACDFWKIVWFWERL